MADIIIGIDTGGTFTDGFFTDGARVEKIKVDTTPHDLSVCFLNCLEEGAKVLGFDSLRNFLKEVRVLRFSSTTSTNVFVQKTGAKTGLIVTQGFKGNLYEQKGKTEIPEHVLYSSLVEEIKEEVDSEGKVVESPVEIQLLDKLKNLLERGIRIVVVSFHNAHINFQNERKVREIIDKYYPRHYLGSLPVIPAGQFCNHPDEAGRTNLAVINAYVHPKVVGSLYHTEDRLRDIGYSKPLLMVDSSGGCSRVAKTKAVELMGSSPVAGYKGAMYWARKYGIPNVITIDIGGTSFDIGMIVDGEVFYQEERQHFGIHVATPVFEVSSIGLGGGSIAKPDLEKRKIEVGPESAGALPGPACYDLGGEHATVTDANLVLNRLNPDYFLGGTRILNKESAYDVIRSKVAEPLDMSVEEAAYQIVERAAELGAESTRQMIGRLGKSPADFIMFAYGGAGGAHCCEIAERLGISKIYSFPFSSTFGAFGTSMMDLTHIYMRHMNIPLVEKGKTALNIDAFNSVIKEEQEKAYRDMIGEGFKREDVSWELDLEIGEGEDGQRILVHSPGILADSESDAEAILRSYEAEKTRRGGAGRAGKNAQIEVFYLKACCPLFKYEFPRYPVGSTEPVEALKYEKAVYGKGWSTTTKVYTSELLGCGNIVPGPAILESKDTTFAVPEGWRFRMDEYLNGLIEKEK